MVILGGVLICVIRMHTACSIRLRARRFVRCACDNGKSTLEKKLYFCAWYEDAASIKLRRLPMLQFFLCMALLTTAIEVAKNPLWLHDQVGNDLERSYSKKSG